MIYTDHSGLLNTMIPTSVSKSAVLWWFDSFLVLKKCPKWYINTHLILLTERGVLQRSPRVTFLYLCYSGGILCDILGRIAFFHATCLPKTSIVIYQPRKDYFQTILLNNMLSLSYIVFVLRQNLIHDLFLYVWYQSYEPQRNGLL